MAFFKEFYCQLFLSVQTKGWKTMILTSTSMMLTKLN